MRGDTAACFWVLKSSPANIYCSDWLIQNRILKSIICDGIPPTVTAACADVALVSTRKVRYNRRKMGSLVVEALNSGVAVSAGAPEAGVSVSVHGESLVLGGEREFYDADGARTALAPLLAKDTRISSIRFSTKSFGRPAAEVAREAIINAKARCSASRILAAAATARLDVNMRLIIFFSSVWAPNAFPHASLRRSMSAEPLQAPITTSLLPRHRSSPSVRSLVDADLSDVIAGRPEEEAKDALRIMAEGLAHCQLRSADFSHNALGEKGIRACQGALVGMTTLESLTLEVRPLRTQLGRMSPPLPLPLFPSPLSSSLPLSPSPPLPPSPSPSRHASPTSQVFLLQNVGLSVHACKALEELLKDPSSLKKLHLANNMSDDEGARSIAALLSRTPAMEDFKFVYCRVKEEGGIGEWLMRRRCVW